MIKYLHVEEIKTDNLRLNELHEAAGIMAYGRIVAVVYGDCSRF